MRRILIDRARRYAAVKHGAQFRRTEFDDIEIPGDADMERLVEWDELLDKLAQLDPTMADVVKLRFFAGMSVPEAASALDISPRTVNRHWTAAQAWLKRELDRGDEAK